MRSVSQRVLERWVDRREHVRCDEVWSLVPFPSHQASIPRGTRVTQTSRPVKITGYANSLTPTPSLPCRYDTSRAGGRFHIDSVSVGREGPSSPPRQTTNHFPRHALTPPVSRRCSYICIIFMSEPFRPLTPPPMRTNDAPLGPLYMVPCQEGRRARER